MKKKKVQKHILSLPSKEQSKFKWLSSPICTTYWELKSKHIIVVWGVILFCTWCTFVQSEQAIFLVFSPYLTNNQQISLFSANISLYCLKCAVWKILKITLVLDDVYISPHPYKQHHKIIRSITKCIILFTFWQRNI